jgi:hypothetical protein
LLVSVFCAVTVTPGKGMFPLFTVPCSLPPATLAVAVDGAGAFWSGAGGLAGADAGGEAGGGTACGTAAGVACGAADGGGASDGAAVCCGAWLHPARYPAKTTPAAHTRLKLACRIPDPWPLVPVFSLTGHSPARFTDSLGLHPRTQNRSDFAHVILCLHSGRPHVNSCVNSFLIATTLVNIGLASTIGILLAEPGTQRTGWDP